MSTSGKTGRLVDFILPDLGEGVHEAEIIAWKVAVGQLVDEMQVLAEMETDKALVEVPSPYAGKVVQLHGKVGEIAHVGQPIVTYEEPTQSGKPVKGGSSSGGGDGGGHGAASTNGSASAAPNAAPTPEASGEREDAGTVVGSLENTPTLGSEGKAMATPAVRRLAKEMGVDINKVRGTGRGGRVTASDVQTFTSMPGKGRTSTAPVDSPAAKLSPAPAPKTLAPITVDSAGTSQTIPFRGVRRKIAEALDRSVRTAVHFTVMDSADVTALDRVRRQQAAASGEKVSFLPFVVQAVCRALRQLPQLNAVVDDAKSEILVKGVINMGIAVDTEHGLMVPNIPNADRLGILPLGRAINDVAAKCRDRTIALDQLKGGTFTISNFGSFGGSFGTPIINYPEVGILGVGRAREAVLARNGAIFIGLQMPLSMSCDHRVVDGVYGAQLLNQVVKHLENPEILLTPAGMQ